MTAAGEHLADFLLQGRVALQELHLRVVNPFLIGKQEGENHGASTVDLPHRRSRKVGQPGKHRGGRRKLSITGETRFRWHLRRQGGGGLAGIKIWSDLGDTLLDRRMRREEPQPSLGHSISKKHVAGLLRLRMCQLG